MRLVRDVVLVTVITGVLVAGAMALGRLFDEWLTAMSWGF